jgi:hypothetical protein
MEIRELRKKDHKKVIQFAIKGMHFELYLKNKFLLNAYGKYFWYLEYTNASQVIAAYEGDKLSGVLIADMKGERKPYKSFWKKFYIKFIDCIQKIFFRGGIMPYDEANKEMLELYTLKYSPDGEIRFLAADPDAKVRGIGTMLLNELEQREKGKEIYLFTDNQCTYQFYEHRGFERINEKDIVLELQEEINLKCFLYRKLIGK